MLLLALMLAALTPPDVSGVISLSTFPSLGHGCPISETEAYTARHVIDPKPFDPDAALLSGIWSDGNGNEGMFRPLKATNFADLGLISGQFKKFYPIAAEPPKVGDKVWIVGYDWRNRKAMFTRRIWELEVLKVVAGMVILDHATAPGSSGSCVLNAQGEAVGILGFQMVPDGTSDERDRVGGAVGLWILKYAVQPEEPKTEEPKLEVIQ